MTSIQFITYLFQRKDLFGPFNELLYSNNLTPVNGNTIELDKLLYDFDPINVETTNIGSMNDHTLIEEPTKKVASSCNDDDVRYAPVNFGQSENIQEDDMGIDLDLNELPETHQSPSTKESFFPV